MKVLSHGLFCMLLLFGSLTVGCGSEFGQVTEGDISVSLTTLSFPQTRVGGSGRNVQFSIRNTGDGDLLIQNIEIVETSPYIGFSNGFVIEMASRFDWRAAIGSQSWSEHPTFTLAAGHEIQVDVLFAPETTDTNCPGGDTDNCGRIVITSNDRDEPTISVGIRLEQSAGVIYVDPTVIRFPDVTGGPYLDSFIISNQGSGPLRINEVSDPGIPGITFSETSNRQEPYELSAGAEAEYEVEFVPQTTAEYCGGTIPEAGCTLGQLTIDSNDANGTVVTVALQVGGVGVPDIELSSTSLVFEATPTDPDIQTVDVSNQGGANLNWNLRIDPSGIRSLFAMEVQDTAYPTSGAQMAALATGNTRTVELTFTPVDASSIHGELVITTNDPDESVVSVDLYGGEPAAEIEVEPTTLFFATVAPGETANLQLMVMNNGRAELRITSAEITGSDNFSLDPDLSDMRIGAGERQPVTASYHRPTDSGAGLQTATLTIVSNALEPNDNFIVSLFANNGEAALPPTAVITAYPGEPYSVDQTVTLSASQSEPPEGGELITNPYNWLLLNAPIGSRAYLTNNYQETTNITLDLPGTYTVMLTVTAGISETVTTQAQATRNLYAE